MMPVTVKGWAQLTVSVLAIVGTLSGAGWQFYHSNAWAGDVQAVEVEAVAAIKALRCEIVHEQIRQLELKQAEGELSPREKAWLQDLLRQWDKHCTGDRG